ncbi:helix-turn-helix transcriptional regulator [Paenibacillus sp. UMB7766-LJ446]|uniref:Helix-turn-helix transcriptional regulator n=1 Tax=Paenibacillus urinalis TaxID=521520 RepID=A0AAX3N6Q5_9BACL|nr:MULTISPECIES: helix-turn-helix transcriptional regulator [Paenibacillus]MDK8194697.1 helix-turn-helix transcriptional regulator [Paenibacillus sp. UMB7766-LJ446]WDH85488.1 helix-turn-helix transcriptional regulator [Paenibacillus urinalis]GAK43410.1 cryptic phage CTXphi transcriptional repressor rstR [Paenibacillus sp. TCA20]SDX85811.1 Helix-turn-helix [Paenibacillus sp. PDC88]
MNQTIAEQIGSIIRKLRTEKGLTQQALADEIGSSFSFVGRVERGESNITLETIIKISSALNIEFFELMSLGRRQDSEDIMEIHALLLKRSEKEQRKALNILKEVFDEV